MRRNSTSSNKGFKKLMTALFFTAVFFGLYSIHSTGVAKIEAGTYTILKGDTPNSIPKRFNVDVNQLYYKIWLRFNAIDLQAGTYKVSSKTTLNELFKNELNHVEAQDREVTILPGWNIFDIDEYLSDLGLTKSGELIAYNNDIPDALKNEYPFLKDRISLEGFLYPDTYRIPVDAKLVDVVKITLDSFKKNIYDDYSSLGPKKFYATLILASIVEKEERNKDNKPVVAGILKNRLDSDVAIGADATVCYAYEKTSSQCTPSFISENIYKKTQYNTRNRIGLPPTPISNMIPESFKSAYEPQKTSYYYYLHDLSGGIHYGITLDEHNRNKNLYLK